MADLQVNSAARAGLGASKLDLSIRYQGTVTSRIVSGWFDIRASARSFIDERPSEGRMLFLVLVTDLVFFVSWGLKMAVAPAAFVTALLPENFGPWLIVAFFARTAVLYIFAGLVGCFGWLSGGTATSQEARAGVIWGAVIAAPVGFVAALLSIMLAALEPTIPALGARWVVTLPYLLSMGAFIWYVAGGVAEAHRLERSGAMIAATTVLAFGGVIGTIGTMLGH